MDNFLFSLNATLPVFLIILLGWALMQLGLFNREFLKVIDKYVFKAALPLLLFHDIATTDIRSVFDGRFVLFCMLATTAMFFGTWLFSWLFLKDKSMVGAFAQASARGSAAILGIAFAQNIYGDSGMAPLMIVSAVPLYNIYSVIILTVSAAAVHPTAHWADDRPGRPVRRPQDNGGPAPASLCAPRRHKPAAKRRFPVRKYAKAD